MINCKKNFKNNASQPYFLKILVGLSLLLVSCKPAIPPYPYYENKAQVISEATAKSEALEAYIKAWLDGEASAKIPDHLIPQGKPKGVKNYYLQRPDEIIPKQQWIIRQAQPVNFKALQGAFPDPNATYLVLGSFLAPFNTKVVMEGEFPHSRFFDVQLTPPFDPTVYVYEGGAGAGEVPIVDADIEPLPGNINPFRVGANRNDPNRKYRLTWSLVAGHGPFLEPAYRPPYYRAPGNHRYASAIQYQGPWGDQKWIKKDPSEAGHGLGVWQPGYFWVRYYAPDKAKGSLGGVPFPKVYYQLDDGRQFYINSDFSEEEARLNQKLPAIGTWPTEPNEVHGKKMGWSRDWGIFLSAASGLAMNYIGLHDQGAKEYVRNLDLGVTGRGENQPPPGNYGISASSCTYISYLNRGMSLGSGKIMVLTGKLPKTPSTRNGEAIMESAQARYYSITTYDAGIGRPMFGLATSSVMDDEIITDEQGWYMIVYSRAEDRPSNASSSTGVTWVNWGPVSIQSLTLRWMSIHPEWNDTSLPVPDEANLNWTTTAWSGKNYDPTIIGLNNHSGFMKEYLPKVHYMTKQEFEALGSNLTPSKIPEWR